MTYKLLPHIQHVIEQGQIPLELKIERHPGNVLEWQFVWKRYHNSRIHLQRFAFDLSKQEHREILSLLRNHAGKQTIPTTWN